MHTVDSQLIGERASQAVEIRASRGWVRWSAAVLGGCFLMTCSAQLRFVVPGTDVPMTLQPVAMLLVGMTLPIRSAAGAMALYLLVGGIGLPVFAGDGGLTGLTAGYLVGFLFAAPLVGFVAGSRRCSFGWLFGAGLAGMSVVLACGVAWRMLRFAGNFDLAIVTGAFPFLVKSVVEAAFTAGVARQWNARKVEIGV